MKRKVQTQEYCKRKTISCCCISGQTSTKSSQLKEIYWSIFIIMFSPIFQWLICGIYML